MGNICQILADLPSQALLSLSLCSFELVSISFELLCSVELVNFYLSALLNLHWNANLEVAVIEHHEDSNIVPMAILRASKDIEKDAEILTRCWHKDKDAWQNMFECQCCACTNHTGTARTALTETANTTTTNNPGPVLGHTPRATHSERKTEDDHSDREMDNLDCDVLGHPPDRDTITECPLTGTL